jgi:large subunit ribosomal protein L4
MLKIVDVKLPKEIFGADVNLKLLAQANHVAQSRAHVGLRNTKTRSEVNRTTKKVYKQKGTGGARHGSRRANLFVGGGVIFGPRPLKRVLEISKSLSKAAMISAFSYKAKEKLVLVVSGADKVAKTKEVAEFVKGLKGKKFTFLLSENSKKTVRFVRNLANVKVLGFKEAGVLDILNGGTLLIDEMSFEKAPVKAEKKVEVKEKPVKTAKPAAKKVIKKSSK